MVADLIASLLDLDKYKHVTVYDHYRVKSIRGVLQKNKLEYSVSVSWADDTPVYEFRIGEEEDISEITERFLDMLLCATGE